MVGGWGRLSGARRRVEVRPWRREDAVAVASWWPEAARSAAGAGAAASVPTPEGCAGEIWSLWAGGSVVGVAVVEAAGGWTTFRLVALAAAARGRGLGSEGVRTLEEMAWAEETCGFRGLAGAENGRALYFWLRLGYRPGPLAPTALGGGLWMLREAQQEAQR